MLGLISLSLALMNMLPLLPLDGGHIAFSMIEGDPRASAVAREVYERVSAVGIALVLFLFVIGISNDVGRSAARPPGSPARFAGAMTISCGSTAAVRDPPPGRSRGGGPGEH